MGVACGSSCGAEVEGAAVVAVAGLMLMACSPFGPWMISN